MSGTQAENDPFFIEDYKVVISRGITSDVTITYPDFTNGIITSQDTAIKEFFGEAAALGKFGPVATLGLASGVAFDVLEGIIGPRDAHRRQPEAERRDHPS